MSSTLIYSDGFDAYASSSATVGFLNKWTSINGFTPATSATTPHSAGQSMSLTGTGHRIQRTFTATKTPVFRGALYLTQLPTNAIHQISLLTGATFQIGFRPISTGAIEAYRSTGQSAGTLLGTSSVCLTAATWHFWEIIANIDDAAGSIEIKIDGTTVLTLTGIDTKNHATIDTVDTLQVGGSTYGGGNFVTLFDHHDMRTGTTSPGMLRITTLYPSADTAQKDWTPNAGATNYTQIDEAQAAVADYVQASAVGNFDLYDFTNLPSTVTFSRIDAVVVNTNALKTDAVGRSIALPVKSGATTTDGSNMALSTTASFLSQHILATDPNGGVAWTQAAVDALQAGLKVTV